jgi:hypothetical protein
MDRKFWRTNHSTTLKFKDYCLLRFLGKLMCVKGLSLDGYSDNILLRGVLCEGSAGDKGQMASLKRHIEQMRWNLLSPRGVRALKKHT